MNISIICVGKIKEKYLTDAIKEYSKRLTPYCKLSIIEVKESTQDDPVEEGENIIKKIPSDSYVFSLDMRGNAYTSEQLSKHLDKLALHGNSNLVFIIGGSNGLSKKVIEKSNELISFSTLTFPHQLIRIFLLEQIYRSFKISKNEPYHK
ncbi:MAG: 23S rRNA (pseudouridine(1915)-N(3))-methyltransferase RlmH [Eubacteriales bacterium]|nr:23S rRNA (pseudouridine(1915)-N(3))-methyltransferase RlmH [Eubacteriales bacterium]MDY3332335.1 23S rRNA (pseudouridine(1915)-N(3))-methyltransferase RlmH [Gallibacter sp.]